MFYSSVVKFPYKRTDFDVFLGFPRDLGKQSFKTIWAVLRIVELPDVNTYSCSTQYLFRNDFVSKNRFSRKKRAVMRPFFSTGMKLQVLDLRKKDWMKGFSGFNLTGRDW